MNSATISLLQASLLSVDAIMTSPPRNLRQDLVDCIINHFRDDSSTLRVIRLVGQKWLPRSTVHLFRRGVVLRYDMDCFNFAKCKPYFYPLVTSLTLTYTDTSSGHRPSMMPNIFTSLTKLENLTLNGACTIKSMSSDTLASLGRLSESRIGCLTTVRLECLGRRVSPQKFPSFPLLLAAFKTGLQKLTISSATQFVTFKPESVNSLLNVEELELQYVRPGSWRHVAQFLDRRLKHLAVDICADQSDRCLPALLSLAPSRLDALRIFHFDFATALYANPVIWGNHVLARDVFFSVADLAWTPVGTANELRALIEWYLDCFVVAPAETFNARFICENSRSSLFVPICDEMWKRWDEMFSESKVLRSLTIELYCMFGRVEDDFCTQAIKDRLPRLSDGGKLAVKIPVV
ncbi:hypothetical protein EV421DRAFT_1906146 [Armillaria borealis]|uniref:F-box domain-containing protein n=1 Tax=Armillaria borealis TaxID=47425 RepID=A0AA39JD39_9AGAR|nr:hypothetical protein EV421DRAFT_1906146 [Armillaria borealis]